MLVKLVNSALDKHTARTHIKTIMGAASSPDSAKALAKLFNRDEWNKENLKDAYLIVDRNLKELKGLKRVSGPTPLRTAYQWVFEADKLKFTVTLNNRGHFNVTTKGGAVVSLKRDRIIPKYVGSGEISVGSFPDLDVHLSGAMFLSNDTSDRPFHAVSDATGDNTASDVATPIYAKNFVNALVKREQSSH